MRGVSYNIKHGQFQLFFLNMSGLSYARTLVWWKIIITYVSKYVSEPNIIIAPLRSLVCKLLMSLNCYTTSAWEICIIKITVGCETNYETAPLLPSTSLSCDTAGFSGTWFRCQLFCEIDRGACLSVESVYEGKEDRWPTDRGVGELEGGGVSDPELHGLVAVHGRVPP